MHSKYASWLEALEMAYYLIPVTVIYCVKQPIKVKTAHLQFPAGNTLLRSTEIQRQYKGEDRYNSIADGLIYFNNKYSAIIIELEIPLPPVIGRYCHCKVSVYLPTMKQSYSLGGLRMREDRS